MIILQISPEFTPGTGVGGVAYALEQEWLALGHEVRRFGSEEAGCAFLAAPQSGLRGRLRHAAHVAWFSTVGTVRARRAVRELPEGAVSICHNDAVAGDVYVNHGILQTAMRARGRYRWRMVRNPLHLFTATRDHFRYRGNAHQVVVNLTVADDVALRGVYPTLRPSTVVIGNGVDIDRFRPPTSMQRQRARSSLSIDEAAVVTAFIGNEFERKGLFALVEAMGLLETNHHLLVVGGTGGMLVDLTNLARRHGVTDRIHAVGRQEDPLPFLWASDILAQPSAYESYGLVVTEALAAGIPVVSTPVGVAPEIIEDDVNGLLTDGTPEDLALALRRLARADKRALRSAARSTAEAHTWFHVSRAYLDLFGSLAATDVVKL